MFARSGEIPAMTLQDIKETKRHEWVENVKTVYPPQTSLLGFDNKYNDNNNNNNRYPSICTFPIKAKVICKIIPVW